jgi:hypothetical protein
MLNSIEAFFYTVCDVIGAVYKLTIGHCLYSVD